MTKESLTEKLKNIQAQKKKLEADFNALCGAEQMLMQLISELEQEESVAE